MFHVLRLGYPLLDKFLSPRELILDIEEGGFVAFDDIMEIYLGLDRNQIFHYV